MNAWRRVLAANHSLLNGSGKLSYFELRGLGRDVIQDAGIGVEDEAFLYPCISRSGDLLGVHVKTEKRDDKGKRRQWWTGHTTHVPMKRNSRPAKVIPFGLETVMGLAPGSLVVLCCGEEDALSLRQAGYTALSQPGAGLLEPVYARELAGLRVVVFYDAGEEGQARKDAKKLVEAGTGEARIVSWPAGAPNGADVNGQLVKDPTGFDAWAAAMIDGATPLAIAAEAGPQRAGKPDAYLPPAPETPWPELASEALHGLPGDFVRAVESETEADSVAVLANFIVSYANAVGGGAYALVGADRHHLNLFVGLVGETSKGRKGTSWSHTRELMHAADTGWAEGCIQNGLSSGEGLIYAVRDPVVSTGKDGEPITADEGAKDKRLLAIEGEFAAVLKVMRRDGNTLSAILRQGWDGGRLQVLTRNSPMKATGAHVSIIGHVTRAELLRHLTETEAANGFANRFLWLMVKRSNILPFGGNWRAVDTAPLVRRLRVALEFGKRAGEISWGESAKGLWRDRYEELSEGKPGLFGAVVGRAEAQVLRLATLYAVMDLSRTIELPHLEAALALWGYAEQSALYVFGDSTGDEVADRIMEALRAAPKGLTRNEIRNLFGRHKSSERIGRALAELERLGCARRELRDTGGRPEERWHAR